MGMTISEIVSAVQTQFLPNVLITSSTVIQQNAVRAIRKLNAVAPMIVYEERNIAARIELASTVQQVFKVYHDGTPRDVSVNTTLQSALIGQPIIQYDDMAIYAGTEQYIRDLNQLFDIVFKWRFLGPYLYIDDYPVDSTKALIREYRSISTSGSPEENIPDKQADWIFEYTLALTKIDEGRFLMTTRSADIDFRGQAWKSEGQEDKDKLERRLRDEMKVVLWGGRGYS